MLIQIHSIPRNNIKRVVPIIVNYETIHLIPIQFD